MTPEECKERVEQKAQAHRFLGKADEKPLIESVLEGLKAANPARNPEIKEPLTKAARRVDDGFDDALCQLRESREMLAQKFIKMQGAEGDAVQRQDLLKTLDSQIHRLYKSLHLQLPRTLRETDPDTGMLSSLLASARKIYQKQVEALPHCAYLILSRNADAPVQAGKTLYDMHREMIREKSCRAPSRVTSWIRFHLYRMELVRNYQIVRVPLQDSAEQNLLVGALWDSPTVLEGQKTQYLESISKIHAEWRAIRFNLETALTELAEDDPETGRMEICEIQELVLGVLERSSPKLKTIGSGYSAYFLALLKEIEREHEEAVGRIQIDIGQAGSFKVRKRWLLRRAQKAGDRPRQRLRQELVEYARRLERFGRKIYFRLEDLVLRVGDALGIRSRVSKESLLLLTDLPAPSVAHDQASRLPPICRRLFTSYPLETREFMVSRKNELAQLEAIFRRWQTARSSCVTVIGPEGSGKTSLLNCFETEHEGEAGVVRKELETRLKTEEDVIRLFESWFSLKKRNDCLPDLVNDLLQLPEQVLLVEGGHNLMLRTIGGQCSAEAFFYVLAATRGHFLWILSMRIYPWKKMNYLFNVSQYFTHEIYTLFHNECELRNAIIQRMKSSGFDSIFSDEGIVDRKIRKLRLSNPLNSSKVQSALEEKYFDDLFEATGGNMTAALYHWLLSLRYDRDTQKLIVSPCLHLDYRFIRDFDRSYLFTLAEVLNHGGLSTEEHHVIFSLDLSESQMILDYLTEIRLLTSSDESGGGKTEKYVVNPVFFYPISSTLESMNILY